jgi:hypothetical protein
MHLAAIEQQKILLRNALQILSIVKATFSSIDFGNHEDLAACTHPDSDAEKLACHWKKAMTLVQDFQISKKDVKPSLNALFEV